MLRRITPDLASTLLALAGMVAVVVGVAMSPAPPFVAVLVGAAEAWVAAWAVAWNAQAPAVQGRRDGPDLRNVA